MFYRFEELQSDVILLPDAEIRVIDRRVVTLHLPNLKSDVTGDVSRTGFTVYFGGFDWVTFVAPSQIVSKFPDLAPLTQQTYAPDEAL